MDDPFYNLKDSIKKDFESFSFSEERKKCSKRNNPEETITLRTSFLENRNTSKHIRCTARRSKAWVRNFHPTISNK